MNFINKLKKISKSKSFKTLIIISLSKKIVMIAVALIFSQSIFSQTNISGKIFDESTKLPIEFANVTAKGVATNFFAGAQTDVKGAFLLKNLPKDTLLISVSFVGYDNYEQKIFVDNSLKTINLKTVFLRGNAKALKEVEVTGMRSQMRFELDKKVFDVDQNIASAGGSASDILQNIPSVEVTNEGEISLRGSTSVEIWINGKPSGLTSDNQAEILEQLPAETIEKVEIITNPSAKYSPEGTAGIINIVLKENRKAGYYGSVQAGGDTRLGYNISGNINYSSSKIETFANIGFRSRVRRNGGFANSVFYPDDFTPTIFDQNDPQKIGYLNQNNNSEGRSNNIFTRLGVTYHATKKDHISLSAFGMFGGGNNLSTVNDSSFVQNIFSKTTRQTKGENMMSGGNVQLGYKHDFSKTSNLDLTAAYNIWARDNKSNFTQNDFFLINNDSTYPNSFQRQASNMRSQMLDFKANYENTINEHIKIEAGYQGTFSFEKSPVETYSGENFDKIDTLLWNNFLYNRYTNALYTTYSGKYGKLNFQVGLRGEYTETYTKSLIFEENENNSDFLLTKKFDLFPSAFLSYEFPKENQLQVNYTRRIRRPWGGQLNSWKNISDAKNISFGNPLLLPEFSNAFEINYIKMWEQHTISFSGYFRNTDDVIQRIRWKVDNNVFNQTSMNVARSISTGAEFVVKNQLWKILNLTTTVNLFYYRISDWSYKVPDTEEIILGKMQDNFSANVRLIANLMLPKKWFIQLTGNYNTPQAIAQGTAKARYSLDAGIRKTLGSFAFNLNARDIFNSRARNAQTFGAGFAQDSRNWWGGRTFSLTVTYSFGNMKQDLRKRQQQQNGSSEEQSSEMSGGYDM